MSHNSSLPSLQTLAKTVEICGFHSMSITSSNKSKFKKLQIGFYYSGAFMFHNLQDQSAEQVKNISELNGLHLTL